MDRLPSMTVCHGQIALNCSTSPNGWRHHTWSQQNRTTQNIFPCAGVWPNETIHFTPWLAKNLSELAAELGVELQLTQAEAYGYGGYTDILAEVAGGGKVVIENQLELSDNDHFARLVGYAADHDAKILIWVAPQFDEYHQRLLGWLDQALGDDRAIHAVQVKLVPGGDLRSR